MISELESFCASKGDRTRSLTIKASIITAGPLRTTDRCHIRMNSKILHIYVFAMIIHKTREKPEKCKMIKVITLWISRVRPLDSLEHLVLLWMLKRTHWSTPFHESFFFFNHIPNNGLLWTKTSIKLYSPQTPIHRMISNYGSFYFNLNDNYLRVTQNITETLAAFSLVFLRLICKIFEEEKKQLIILLLDSYKKGYCSVFLSWYNH